MTKILVDKAVLEQALESLNSFEQNYGELLQTPRTAEQLDAVAAALRAALEQPQGEQEPVAWLFQHEETGLTEFVDVQQVEWGFEKNNPRWQKIYPVYLNPQPKRQPLTDEQIFDLAEQFG